MITKIEAVGYRSLRSVSQSLDRFHVLVGPNASGKTTFLDVVAFLGTLVSDGLDAAVESRTQNFADLTWCREGKGFGLAIELAVPDEIRPKLRVSKHDTLRYEVGVTLDQRTERVGLTDETLLLKTSRRSTKQIEFRGRFPRDRDSRVSILEGSEGSESQIIIKKVPGGSEYIHSETGSEDRTLSFKLGARRSALANLPEDEFQFPTAIWLKTLLSKGIQQLVLNSLLIRQASRPGQGRTLKPDGSNLPWVIAELEEKNPELMKRWIDHLRTALPDLEGLRTVIRPDDRHRYLMVRYQGGLEVPSWMASDGTLRLLALTLPAYTQDFSGIYLIEEPENGIHPRAVETMFQSLSSVYDAQVLLASHSPVVLGIVDPGELLCFAKDRYGATDIVRGSEHPALREWRGETNLSTLYAAGVLG